jgi:hypothetical protein
MMAKYFGHVVGDREGGQRAAGHQQLLADLDDLDELGGSLSRSTMLPASRAPWCRCSSPRRRRPGRGRGVVGAVAAHRYQLALRLLVADQLELGSGVAWARNRRQTDSGSPIRRGRSAAGCRR